MIMKQFNINTLKEPSMYRNYTNGCFTAHVHYGTAIAKITNTCDDKIRYVMNCKVLTALDAIRFLNACLPGTWHVL